MPNLIDECKKNLLDAIVVSLTQTLGTPGDDEIADLKVSIDHLCEPLDTAVEKLVGGVIEYSKFMTPKEGKSEEALKAYCELCKRIDALKGTDHGEEKA